MLADPPGPLRLSVSATTRRQRQGEQDGRDYHFWTREHFEEELARGAFLEHALVFGHYYGTLRREVEPYRQQGQGVILDIDVQGAEQIRRQCPDQAEHQKVVQDGQDQIDIHMRARPESLGRRAYCGACTPTARGTSW